MSELPGDESLLQRLNNPTDSAAERLDREFRPRLEALAERGIDRRLARRESPEDIVQSVLRTVFRRTAAGEYRFTSRGELWRLLETVTRHKLLNHAAHHRAQKRTPQAEEYLPDDALFAQSPTPDQEAIAKDLVAEILADLDQSYAEIISLLQEGHSERAIAERLGCTRRAVTTKIERLRKRLAKLLEDETHGALE